MNLSTYKRITLSQFLASLAMFEHTIRTVPAAGWRKKVGTWPFWLVAYHTLCYVDCYSAPSNTTWKPHPTFHPKGRKELIAEYPSRDFSRDELLAYCEYCRAAISASIRRETAKSLAAKSGFPWLKFTRAELHLYNLRHLAHHTGQLSAVLRRYGKKSPWVSKS